MAIGDNATAKGMPLVPDTGVNDASLVKMGAREINRTRDFVADTRDLIMSIWSLAKGGTGASNKADARTNLGITSGTGVPSGGDDGDIYFRIVT